MYFSIRTFFVRLTHLRNRWHIFLIKLSCNLCTAFSLHVIAPQSEGKNIPHDLCLPLIDNNCILYFPAFLIPKGNLSENIFPVCTFVFKRSLYLHRNILAVQVIKERLKCSIYLYRVSMMLPAVIMVVDCDKADPHKGKYLVQIRSHFDIIP